MRSIVTRFVLLGSLAVSGAAAACTANIHDNKLDIENPKVSINTSADVNAVVAGDSIPLTLKADNVTLVAPDQTPPPGKENVSGFFEIHLDDEESDALVVTAQTSVSVTIPKGTKEGEHKLICRLHSHDGASTNSVQELMINVKASASVTTGTTTTNTN